VNVLNELNYRLNELNLSLMSYIFFLQLLFDLFYLSVNVYYV